MKQTIIIIAIFISTLLQAQQTRIISDCTISFIVTSSKQEDLGHKIFFIKGKDARVDLKTRLDYSQSIIFNGNNGGATVLQEVGRQKFISTYTAEQWKKQNQVYDGIKTSFTDGTKKILDYNCKQALLTLANGVIYTVYYVPSLVPSVSENLFEFKDVPGLVLEYESIIKDNQKVTYTAEKIDFSPVPAAQFEIPKSGYRILQ